MKGTVPVSTSEGKGGEKGESANFKISSQNLSYENIFYWCTFPTFVSPNLQYIFLPNIQLSILCIPQI